VPSVEKLADLCELTAIRMHEQEGVLGATFPGLTNYLAANQSEYELHEEVHASGAGERSVRWAYE